MQQFRRLSNFGFDVHKFALAESLSNYIIQDRQPYRLAHSAAGMGLGKDLQGMANKIEATANKGKSGLGLGGTHPLTPSTTPDYTPQPDTAILTHDHAALSFEEMEWWRIMEQRKPAKLLRSKFLPKDDILLAVRTAREMSHAWHSHQVNKLEVTMPNQATPDGVVSSADGGRAIPLLIQTPESSGASPSADVMSGGPGAMLGSPGAAPNSPEAFCLHQAPCVSPQDVQHSGSFWNIASLDSAFNICSSLAAMQQSSNSPDADLCLLDLSMSDCGATEYVLTHGGVRVQSAQVMPGEAAEKLQSSASNVAGVVQPLSANASAESDDSATQAPASVALSTQLKDSTSAQTDLLAATPVQAEAGVSKAAVALDGAGKQLPDSVAEPLDVALLPDSFAAEGQELHTTPSAYSADAAAHLAVTDADVTDSTHMQAATQNAVTDQHSKTANLSAAMPAAYSLKSYEAMKASLKAAHLVIGSLGPVNGQRQAPIGKGKLGSTDRQPAEGSGQGVPTAQEGGVQPEGVMEAEYADGYRARLLWECAVALSCLQPGIALLTGCVHGIA